MWRVDFTSEPQKETFMTSFAENMASAGYQTMKAAEIRDYRRFWRSLLDTFC